VLNLPLNNNNHKLLRFIEQPNSHVYASFGCRADVLSVSSCGFFVPTACCASLRARPFFSFTHCVPRVCAPSSSPPFPDISPKASTRLINRELGSSSRRVIAPYPRLLPTRLPSDWRCVL
jgi:hypothetical protein